MNAVLIDITPENAKKWLDVPTANRKVSPNHVAALQRIIENGEWCESASMIQIGYNGEVIDGQHRLIAIMKSGKTVRNIVLFGARKSDAIDTMGRKRTYSDVFSINDDGTDATEFLKVKGNVGLCRYVLSYFIGIDQPTISDIRRFYRAFSDKLVPIGNIGKSNTRGISCASVKSAVFFALVTEKEEGALDWYSLLFNGYRTTENVNDDSLKNIIILRNALIEKGISGQSGRYNDALEKCYGSVIGFCKGSTMRRKQVPDDVINIVREKFKEECNKNV